MATAVAVLLVSFSPVVSAGGADVGIQPAYPIEGNTRSASIFIMTLKPEETGKNGVKLINTGTEPHTVQIYPVDGAASADGSFSCRQESEARKEVGTWVTLSKQKLTIEPNAEEVVDFNVTVPQGTGPGEHNGCIAVQDLANQPAKTGEGILLGFRSAIRLAVRVPGKIVKQLEFVRVGIEPNHDGTIIVSPVAKNTGNVSLDVQSYAQLVGIFGQKTKVKNNTSCPIIPGATLTSCSSTFERPYWGGLYKARTSLSYNSNVADTIGDKASKTKRISMTSAYFVSWPDPLAGLAEVAALLAIFWLIITPFRRRIRRRRIIRNWEKYVVQEGDTIMSIAAARNAKWKKVARFNRLKAPYALTVGQPVIVPKPVAAKPKKLKRRKRRSELDWLLDTEPTAAASVQDSPAAPAAETPTTPAPTAPAQPTAVPEPPVAPPPPPPAAPHNGWVTPDMYRDRAASEEEPDEDFMDWREGANSDELAEIETKLGDYSAMPHMRTQLPGEKETPKKSTTRKKTTKASKAPKTKRSSKSKKGS